MLNAIKRPEQHFNPYYYHNSILIPWIVIEFLKMTKVFGQLARKEPHSLSTLNMLTSDIKFPNYCFLQNRPRQSLSKLKSYCSQYVENDPAPNKQSLLIQELINDLYAEIPTNIDSLTSLEKKKTTKKVAKILSRQLELMAEPILHLLKLYRDNRCITFFLSEIEDQLKDMNKAHKDEELFQAQDAKKRDS